MTHVHLQFVVPPECEQYLESSARLRGVSRTQLLKRTLELVLQDQMFLSVLDDADAPSTRTATVRTQRAIGRPRTMPPRDRLYDALQAHATPTRAVNHSPARPLPKTREQLERELTQAVLNTGGELVK